MSRSVIGKGPMQQLVQPTRQGTSLSKEADARWNQSLVFLYRGEGPGGVGSGSLSGTAAHSPLKEKSTTSCPCGE
jgi:hypothetical protein